MSKVQIKVEKSKELFEKQNQYFFTHNGKDSAQIVRPPT